MPIQFRKNLAIIPKDLDPQLTEWLDNHGGQVFRLRAIRGDAYFQCLGHEEEACRIPINITSSTPGELKFVSNFAATPFVLDELAYGSVEGFWQSLKFADEVKRREVAMLDGSRAKDAGGGAPPQDAIIYGETLVRVGTWDHWQLMERACVAKFEQNERARNALLSTGKRPLVHEMKNDSKTIPGVIMAAIWIRCRERLLNF
jgi:predicted NAD-dependent protein-ADP-ribosyltransferase YbiA (DUF1768 family)